MMSSKQEIQHPGKVKGARYWDARRDGKNPETDELVKRAAKLELAHLKKRAKNALTVENGQLLEIISKLEAKVDSLADASKSKSQIDNAKKETQK